MELIEVIVGSGHGSLLSVYMTYRNEQNLTLLGARKVTDLYLHSGGEGGIKKKQV